MPLDENQICFPNNIVNAIANRVKFVDPDENVGTPEYYEGARIYKRPLNRTDDTRSISVVAVNWQPIMSSKEMGRRTQAPILQDYFIAVQVMIKDADEERAIATHSLLSTRVRHMIYHDPVLAVVLPQLKVTFSSIAGDMTEGLDKWDVTGQNFMNHELGSMFVYLSTLEITARTSIS